MTGWLPWTAVALPLAAAGGIGFLRGAAASWGAVAAAAATLMIALALGGTESMPGGLLRVDRLAAHLAILGATCGLLATWNGRGAGGRPAGVALAVLAAIELAALADHMLLGWLGLAAAVLVPLLADGRLTSGRGRALLAMVLALALVLFGMVLLNRSGVAPHWGALAEAAPGLPAEQRALGFILVLGGLATCAGLAPLHGWVREVGRGQPMVAAQLPVLAAVALAMLLRARGIVAAGDDSALAPGPALLAFGLASLAWAALALWRGRPADLAPTAGLFLAGLATLGFGLGGGNADAAGLLLLSAGALLAPLLRRGGWEQAGVLAALALLPPFATFGAALALLGVAMAAAPWLGLVLAGLMVAGASGLARAALRPHPPMRMGAALPALLVLALALGAGVAPPAAGWFAAVAEGLR